jgi:predicted transcriptional regulator
MSTTLTISVSDAVMARLRERAAAAGTTPEAVVAADLEQMAVAAKPGDKLRKWVGAFNSGIPGWAEKHDEYLGQALYDEMTGRTDDGDVR